MKFVLLSLLLVSCASIGSFMRSHVAPHVHQITSEGEPHCTGFDITYKGKTRTITNAHCCNDPEISIGGKRVSVIKYDRPADLCELQGSDQTRGLTVSNRELTDMDEVHTVGFPANYGKTIRHGYVTNTTEVPTLNFYPVFQTTMHVYGGASGSPVLNNKGEVVGVIAMTNYFKEGLYIKLETLKRFLDDRN